jgi:hypothetical protein
MGLHGAGVDEIDWAPTPIPLMPLWTEFLGKGPGGPAISY